METLNTVSSRHQKSRGKSKYSEINTNVSTNTSWKNILFCFLKFLNMLLKFIPSSNVL